LTQRDAIKEIIKEEDEYKNNNSKKKEENNIERKNRNNIRTQNENNNFKLKKGNYSRIIKDKLNTGNNIQTLILKNLNIKKINKSSEKTRNKNPIFSSSFKKSKHYRINVPNETENISKFRQGLSAGNSNSNIIIPLMGHSNSLLIFNGLQTGKNISQKSNYKLNNIYNKSRNDNRQNLNHKYNTFVDIKMGIENRKKLLNKMHKIKIEKGMMNSNVLNLKKYSLGEYTSLPKENIFLPMLFDDTNKKIISYFKKL